jgi:predicted transposase/invertase (TIGR01784 family)
MRFFAAREEEEYEMLSQSDPAIGQAWSVIKNLSEDESTRLIAEYMERVRLDEASREYEATHGREEGRKEGREEGMQEARLVMARNLLQNNVSAEIIAVSSGLSLDEVKRLADKEKLP